MPCGRRWFVAWTTPRIRFVSLAALWDSGIQTFQPRIAERSGRIVDLWPGYLPVSFDPKRDPWGIICRTPGVGGLIRHGWESPTPLPRGAIEHLQTRTSPRGVVDDPGETWPTDIPRGASVEVRDGPLAGLRGIVTLSGPARCRVLLSLFAATVPLNVPTANLAVVP
jgi:transcription antitermination factor NusG